MAKQIELQFLNEENRTVTISLEDPVDPVNPAEISAAMDTVISENALTSSGGNLVAKKGARIVERTVTEIALD
ncbi:DUF2922 domain-containing protein [Pueribacillus theae]|uniref:DUF2922 domain-containing protein n=1 Tax=Pueribacillus theae TaxID=2171751 RepID=A0A2U1JUZ9_9BACI|nr:DUF2922 domain-containing protein [Pueribacillus theae]PWA09027.1 DUF2922 domain-containing protein [Pueribacillus theae]